MNEKQLDEDGLRETSPSSSLPVADANAPPALVSSKRQSLSDIFTIVRFHPSHLPT